MSKNLFLDRIGNGRVDKARLKFVLEEIESTFSDFSSAISKNYGLASLNLFGKEQYSMNWIVCGPSKLTQKFGPVQELIHVVYAKHQEEVLVSFKLDEGRGTPIEVTTKEGISIANSLLEFSTIVCDYMSSEMGKDQLSAILNIEDDFSKMTGRLNQEQSDKKSAIVNMDHIFNYVNNYQAITDVKKDFEPKIHWKDASAKSLIEIRDIIDIQLEKINNPSPKSTNGSTSSEFVAEGQVPNVIEEEAETSNTDKD